MRSQLGRSSRAIAAVCVAAAVLAGCFGDENDPDPLNPFDTQLDIEWRNADGSIGRVNMLPEASVGALYDVRFRPVDALSAPPNCITSGVTRIGWRGLPRELPAGLDLTPAPVALPTAAEIRLSGTPTDVGEFEIVIGIADLEVNGLTCYGVENRTFTLIVGEAAPLVITTTSLPAGSVGSSYDAMLLAGGGTAPLAWEVVTGTLPPGLSLDAGSGRISGTPSAAADFNLTVEVRDSGAPQRSASRALAISILDEDVPPPLSIVTTSIANGVDEVAYSQLIEAQGGTAPLTFAVVSGAPPGGIVLDGATGALAGTPSVGGSFAFTVQVRDSSMPPQTDEEEYTILVLEIATTSLADGTTGAPYSQALMAVAGTGALSWSLAAASVLPAGLTLSAAGVVSGTPTAPGSYSFTVQVTDSDTPPRTDTQSVAMLVASQNPVPTLGALTPSTANAGGPAFALSIGGSNFIAGSVVRWNGSDRATTFVSATQLTAAITAADMAQAGSAAVAVFNPPPGGGLSNTASFTIGGGAAVATVDRISISDNATPANSGTLLSDISEDGDVTIFTSAATNLDGAARCEVFARRVSTGNTRCAARGIDGTEPNAGDVPQLGIALSANGQWMTFASSSNNLVSDDTSSAQQSNVFVGDTCVPSAGPAVCLAPLELVSRTADGTVPASGASSSPALSRAGRYVAFVSNSPLAGLAAPPSSQVYLRDRQTSQTSLVSASTTGGFGNGASLQVAVTPDGRYIAFVSEAGNLVAGDTNGRLDVFVRDTCLNAGCIASTTRVSVSSDGQQQSGGSNTAGLQAVAISDDGRYVAFSSTATNLVDADGDQQFDDDTNNAADIFLHDRQSGDTTRVSVGYDGSQSADGGRMIGMSGNARLIAFATFDSALVPVGDFGDFQQIVARDTCIGAPSGCTPATFLVSQRADGTPGNGNSERASLSGDGRFAVFRSPATNLLPTGNSGGPHVFRATTGRP